MGQVGMEASAEADTGDIWARGEKGVLGLTVLGQQQLLSRCPESWQCVPPKQKRANRGNLGSRR